MSEQSGRAAAQRALLGNAGNVLFLMGRFDEALDHFNGAIKILPSTGENCNATLDSLARVRLTQGLTDECGRILDRIDESIQTKNDEVLFPHRYAQLTRVELLERNGQFREALEAAQFESLAKRAGDGLLGDLVLPTKAELLWQSAHLFEWNAVLDLIVDKLPCGLPDLHAHYERILACALAADGDLYSARTHFDRAKRIYDSLGHVPGLMELNRRWALATAQPPRPKSPDHDEALADETSRARHAVQSTAALMLHAGRPESSRPRDARVARGNRLCAWRRRAIRPRRRRLHRNSSPSPAMRPRSMRRQTPSSDWRSAQPPPSATSKSWRPRSRTSRRSRR